MPDSISDNNDRLHYGIYTVGPGRPFMCWHKWSGWTNYHRFINLSMGFIYAIILHMNGPPDHYFIMFML